MTKSQDRVLIIAAGDGTRWGNHRGVPKHLVEIEGEVLLHRTARQFLEYTSDVVIVGPDERYLVGGASFYTPDISYRRELDKFASSMSQWNSEGRTVIVYGDVYFTDEAIETIMTNQDSWRYFCRSGASLVTGKTAKEIFAIAFNVEDKPLIASAIKKLYNSDTVTGGWSLFRELTLGTHLLSTKDERMFQQGKHVEINDWTEDFDFPEDLDTWEANRAKARQ
jgi:hypothetical protein